MTPNETIADIVRDIRARYPFEWSSKQMDSMLDRIEAAAERERAALDAARKVAKDTAEQYRKLYEKKKEADNQLAELEERYPIVLEQSNAAAMREALERCNEFFRCDDDNKLRLCTLARKADEATQAALAAPARNCDVSKDTAEERYLTKFGRPWTTQEDELAAWLYAPAEGGDHA